MPSLRDRTRYPFLRSGFVKKAGFVKAVVLDENRRENWSTFFSLTGCKAYSSTVHIYKFHLSRENSFIQLLSLAFNLPFT